MRKGERWLMAALLLLMAIFAGLIGYILIALSNLQEDLAQDPGEDMVWAIAQASYQNNLLLQALYAPGDGHRGNRVLQHALLRGRLEVLLAPTQRPFMERAGVRESLLQIKEMLSAQQPDHAQMQVDLHAIAQQIMRTRLDLTGERRDDHEDLLRLLIISIGGVILAGGLLCWQLLRSLARVRRARDQARHLLEELEREKEARLRYRDFVSVMSHQLRTPLAVIDSSAQRLSRQAGDTDSVQARSQRIRGSVRQLNQLIARVLQGLRVDEERGESIVLEFQRCDWEELVRQALDGFDELLAARPVELSWAPGIARPLWLECDRLWCVEVLTNLISNAHKYSPPGTPIAIYVDVDSAEGALFCSVSDSGPGIPEESLSRLFEPFYRGQAQESVSDGVGLGLSIARALVHWHGGRLTATNRSERGACFTLQLPLRQTPAETTSLAPIPGLAR